MKTISKISLIIVIGLMGLVHHSTIASTTQLPIATFAKSASYLDVKISPDGDYLATRIESKGDIALVIFDRSDKKMLSSTRFTNGTQVGEFYWVSNDRLVMKQLEREAGSEQLNYYGQLYAVNADGSNRELIYGYNVTGKQTGSRLSKKDTTQGWADIIDILPQDDSHILISSTPWSKSKGIMPTVYKLNVENGKMNKVASGPVASANYITNQKGELTLSAGTLANGSTKVYRFVDGEKWQEVTEFDYGGDFTPVTMSSDSNSLYTLDNPKHDTTGLYKLNLTTGDYKQVYAEKDIDVTSVQLSINKRRVIAMRFDPDYPTYIMLDKASKEAAIFKNLVQQFPGQSIELTSHDKDGNLWVIYTSSAYSPGTYYLYDKKKNKIGRLFQAITKFPEPQMTEVVPIEFKSQDKLTIKGYITYTATEKQKPMPMVVLIHGGPVERDYWEYNSEVQMLASQGYRVLQINYRGSYGYGGKFLRAGDGHWGDTVQQDIIDGTRWAIAQNLAVKDKICIMGSSFGAYSALQSSLNAPDLFKCVVANAGIYDLTRLYTDGDIADLYTGKAYLQRTIGEDPAQLNAFSPVNHVNKLNAPVFIAHGNKDQRAPVEHAEALIKALKKHKKDYVYFNKNREGHGFANEQNVAEYYQSLSDFIQQHIN